MPPTTTASHPPHGTSARTQNALAQAFDAVLELAEAAKGDDEHGHRAEFINLVKKAQGLKR